MGIAALVLGIIGILLSIFFIGGILGVIGLILGIVEVVKKKNQKKGIAIAGIVLCSIAILITMAMTSASSPDDKKSKSTLSNNTSQEVTQNTQKAEYNVGEIYENDYIAIKYVSKNDNFTGYSKYANVKSGYKVVKAEFEFENVSDSDQGASAYDFNCYADGYDCESFYYADDSGFTASLSSGKKTKGSVYFQVPKNANEITLEYETNYWTSNHIIFRIK